MIIMVIVVRNMTNTPWTGNAYFDARIIENSKGLTFSQCPREHRTPGDGARPSWHHARFRGTVDKTKVAGSSGPRSRGMLRTVGAFLALIGLGGLTILLGLTAPWYTLVVFAVALVGEVLIIASLIPWSGSKGART